MDESLVVAVPTIEEVREETVEEQTRYFVNAAEAPGRNWNLIDLVY